jgi:hypothetical protein
MKVAALCLALFAVAAGAATPTADADGFVHFPALAERVLGGDAEAFRQLLAQAEVTPPGEQLEELAELSSRFVRLAPSEFLRGQANGPTCFGVSFMGASYVDKPEARERERTLRRKALESVADPALAPAKHRCLEQLDGGE